MPLSTKFRYIFFHRSLTLAALAMLSGAVHAQMGVAPSQTGMFFNDIRIRAEQVRSGLANPSTAAGTTTTGTEGFYTFDESQYTGQPIDQRALGTPLGFDAMDREVGSPLGSGASPTSYSRRMAGNNSGYNGPYPSSNTFFAPTYVSDPYLAGKRNLKLGPVNIGLGLTGAIEYNDNVLRASTYRAPVATPDTTTGTATGAATGTTTGNTVDNPRSAAALGLEGKLSDFIGSVYLNVDLNYPISEYNRLTITASLGVSRYFNYPELATAENGFNLTVLPGTAIAFDIKVGELVFVLYDRMSVQPASLDEFALDNRDIFGAFQNDAGIGMNWAINSEVNLSLNINRSDSIALQDSYARYDRTVHSLSGSLAWTPNGTWTIGLEGSYSIIDYKEEFNNDGNTASIGVFVVLPVTKSTIMRVAGGFQSFDFDTPPLFERTVSDQDLTTSQVSITGLNDQITSLNEQIAAIDVTTTDPAEVQAAQAQLAALQSQLTTAQGTLTQQTTQRSSEDTTFNSRSFDRLDTLNDYYYNVVISNQLSARVAQQLSFGHESSLNNTSNLITADYASYGIAIIAWRGARLSLSGFYEKAVESGGTLREDTEQYGFDVNLMHRLGEHLTASVGYHYGDTKSDLVDRDYVQHSISVDFNYKLTAKWNAGLGYQYWKTDAEDPTQTFTQNRIILSTNYNF